MSAHRSSVINRGLVMEWDVQRVGEITSFFLKSVLFISLFSLPALATWNFLLWLKTHTHIFLLNMTQAVVCPRGLLAKQIRETNMEKDTNTDSNREAEFMSHRMTVV